MGGGGGGDAIDEVIEELIEMAADTAYEIASGMVGNEGQASLVDEMSDAFYEAAEGAAEGDEAGSILESSSSAPEAIEEIIMAAADFIQMIGEVIQTLTEIRDALDFF